MGYWTSTKNLILLMTQSMLNHFGFLFKKLYKKNLVYEGYAIQYVLPPAGTGLK